MTAGWEGHWFKQEVCLKPSIPPEQLSKDPDTFIYSFIFLLVTPSIQTDTKFPLISCHIFFSFSSTSLSNTTLMSFDRLGRSRPGRSDGFTLGGSLVNTAPDSPPRTHLTLSLVFTLCSFWKEIFHFILIHDTDWTLILCRRRKRRDSNNKQQRPFF